MGVSAGTQCTMLVAYDCVCRNSLASVLHLF